MNSTKQLAKHVREVYFGGNWTTSNFKEQVANLRWEDATKKISSFNTIAALVFHTNYYISAVNEVFKGKPLEAHDKFSFDHPPIQSQEDWEKLLEKSWAEAEIFANFIEEMPDSVLWENFTDAKYGTYFRNILGIIEHLHYHLGQIALLRKMIKEE